MIDAVLHLGHCFRTRGATGTRGHRGTEQQFVARVGEDMASLLRLRGYTVETALADDPDMPRCRVFMALHQDGSSNSSARGASAGYPRQLDADIAQIWKAHYTRAGWPSGFRPDNYTRGLRRYYGYRRVHADRKILVEHGFATNRLDCDWMWDHIPDVVRANCDALTQWLGPTEPIEGDDVETLIDTTTNQAWITAGQRARPLSDPAAWLTDWDGPIRRSSNMRYVIPDLYDVVT